jgi:hypothetical protein
MPQQSLAEYPTAEPPVPEAVLARAHALVKEYAHCFVAWSRTPIINSRDDVKEVIQELRAYGGHRAWKSAQELLLCL